MDYKQKWEWLKEWLENAVVDGKTNGYNLENKTFQGGCFYAYHRTLEEMKIKDGEMNASN